MRLHQGVGINHDKIARVQMNLEQVVAGFVVDPEREVLRRRISQIARESGNHSRVRD